MATQLRRTHATVLYWDIYGSDPVKLASTHNACPRRGDAREHIRGHRHHVRGGDEAGLRGGVLKQYISSTGACDSRHANLQSLPGGSRT
jgi:hypothetical protein